MSKSEILLNKLSKSSRAEFLAILGGLFEHSSWVAEGAYGAKPFDSLESLHEAMCQVVRESSREDKLRLIRAHPELTGNVAALDELTMASKSEQGGAGLDRCSPQEFQQLNELNAKYREKFGFPFILAVKGHTRASIIESFSLRLNNDWDAEFAECLSQIFRITRFRLFALADAAS